MFKIGDWLYRKEDRDEYIELVFLGDGNSLVIIPFHGNNRIRTLRSPEKWAVETNLKLIGILYG